MKQLLFVVVCLFSLGIAHAHRQPEMVSTIEYVVSEDGLKSTQIIHRIHAHDAMKIIGLWKDVPSANLDDPELLDRLAQTLMDSLDMSGTAKLVGREVDLNYLYVYEEIDGHALLLGGRGLSLLDRAWTHRVDLRQPSGALKSHTFSEHRGITVSERTAAAIAH